MADTNLISTINTNGEVDVSMLLDTLMYSDCLRDEYNGETIEFIVQDMLINPKFENSEQRSAVENVKTYLDAHPDSAVGELRLHSASDQIGKDYEGGRGAAFYSEDSNGKVQDVYVAYRGTGEGRWYDNGDAFSKVSSPYQEDAAHYFDYVMDDLNVDESCNVTVTGHSKGGNLSQYVALDSENAALVDSVISFDGQGFSPEAIEHFKSEYGEEFYEQQLQKMYSISGDNDYVNVLGEKIIPEDHTVYIETPTDVLDFTNGHSLYDKSHGNLFDYESGTFHTQTTQQRGTALVATLLSDYIMGLPPEPREDICRTVMSICESCLGGETNKMKSGLNGEKATLEEILGFVSYIDDIVVVVVRKEGEKVLNKIVGFIQDQLKKDFDTSGSLTSAIGKKAADSIIKSIYELYEKLNGTDYSSTQGYLGNNGGSCNIQVILPFLKSTVSDMQNITNTLNRLGRMIGDEANHIGYSWSGASETRKRLSTLNKNVVGFSSATMQMRDALTDVMTAYENTEKRIINYLR